MDNPGEEITEKKSQEERAKIQDFQIGQSLKRLRDLVNEIREHA